jgi:predicted transcriptional regulator YheO
VDLQEKGLFLIKGAQKVSEELNVSLPTIYNILKKFAALDILKTSHER